MDNTVKNQRQVLYSSNETEPDTARRGNKYLFCHRGHREHREMNYKENTKCSNCGGDIKAHCCGVRIIYWCEHCGSNDDKIPPNINIQFDNSVSSVLSVAKK
jgi:formamidopyrimidine-DNA glycosylase